MRRYAAAVVAAGLIGLAGCGGGPRFAPVSGRVTMNNQPLAGVQVDFQPVAPGKDADPGPGSIGKTDADGRYTLYCQLDPSRAGAVVGTHHVRVWPPESAIDRDAEARRGKKARPAIPGRYHVNSQLKFDVPPGGTSDANFALTSP